MDPTTDLDELSPKWRSVLKVLAAQIVAVRQANEDIRSAHETAVDKLFEGSADVLPWFSQLRHEALEAKRQEFDSLSDQEFQAQAEAVITEALAKAGQSVEPRPHKPVPVC